MFRLRRGSCAPATTTSNALATLLSHSSEIDE
jgi:hypothetical protein